MVFTPFRASLQYGFFQLLCFPFRLLELNFAHAFTICHLICVCIKGYFIGPRKNITNITILTKLLSIRWIIRDKTFLFCLL